MNDTAFSLALREVQRVVTTATYWAISAAIALILGLSGPFGTDQAMLFAPRLGYWALIVATTGPAGWLAANWVMLRFDLMNRPLWLGGPLAGAAVAVVVSGIVHLVNVVTRGVPLTSVQSLAEQAPATPVIGIVVTLAILWINRRMEPPPAPAPVTTPVTAQTLPAQRLMARLPYDKRGALWSLGVQDHYTEVTTSAGRALVLLRLSDAIAEAEGVPGLQIHRSHWVALAAVAQVRRDGARGIVTLKDGRELPISRSWIADAKGAGLL